MSNHEVPQDHLYRGRFAPSPSGPLHFGSVITALGSYLRARSQGGKWLIRIDDIDPPREQPGAATEILRALEAYQLHWDGPVLYQSTRHDAYAAALAQLAATHDTYSCSCTRTSIATAIAEARQTTGTRRNDNPVSNGPLIYPGTCRKGMPAGTAERAIRIRVPARTDTFTDGLQGTVQTTLESHVGDFVVRRADGFFAYHLAAAVDDAAQGITEIVRGSDLLTSTPPQRYLQSRLGYPHPAYCHLPIATNQQGQKLSKQTYAPAIDIRNPSPTLVRALDFLGQRPDIGLSHATPAEILSWAIKHWSLQNVPHRTSTQVESDTS